MKHLAILAFASIVARTLSYQPRDVTAQDADATSQRAFLVGQDGLNKQTEDAPKNKVSNGALCNILFLVVLIFSGCAACFWRAWRALSLVCLVCPLGILVYVMLHTEVYQDLFTGKILAPSCVLLCFFLAFYCCFASVVAYLLINSKPAESQ
eukprot:gnl/MRDRNA2_/MRDRNA2_67760_c0_seq1.p1 gnl/MRDRNA2_/MRDRNA2_67760_c0~~gnl/MRDRNA2_/MRDRNA2_67760_c0_seq1.p1  ORF type:complete len:152 (-),score=18.47 gnl/MRDRNA2_/MRDRNA2_67760_c0_seq1:17-472(-)